MTPRDDVEVISSDRLRLQSVGVAFLRAVLEGRIRAAQALAGCKLPEGWAAEAEGVLRTRLEQLEQDPTAQPWLLRLVVRKDTDEVIGYINFHEPPGGRDWVEIGYSIAAAHRARGYATEAALAMFRWAAEQGIRRFRASVSPGNAASLAMVAAMGFQRVGVQ